MSAGEEQATGRREPGPCGVLVVDKPAGPTSHDVVAKLRRTLGTREIGHAGTLDPAATGVLVVAVGEATKLVAYLTAADKSYLATVTFGRATATLDAEGETVSEAPIPASLAEDLGRVERGEPPSGPLAAAIARELGRTSQVPPAFSAIKQGGRPAHERARRGESVELAPRDARALRIEVVGAGPGTLALSIVVSKGYYVRSLARDLGDALGVPAHLATLRRTASGAFGLDEAVDPAAPRDELLARLAPIPQAAARVMAVAGLTGEGVTRARQGKRLHAEHFAGAAPGGLALWVDPDGAPVAIGEPVAPGGEHAVRRGFAYDTSIDPT